MSLRASDSTSFEVPARAWADRAADGLAVAGAASAAWACTLHAGAAFSAVLGCAVLLVLLAFKTVSRSERGAGVLEHRPDGRWVWHTAHGCADPVEPGGGCRRFGPTVVLDLRGTGGRRCRKAWITPLDMPSSGLRRLAVRLPSPVPGERARPAELR
jgi:hypothetical protein